MSCLAIVPVKAAAHAKSRLARLLSPSERAALVERMLRNVLRAARAARQVDALVVVTPEPRAIAGARVCIDRAAGLNEALLCALSQLEPLRHDALVVVPADLPLLEADDLDAIIRAGQATGFAIAPDRTGAGTNALYLRLPRTIEFRFGPGSFARHVAAGRLRGHEPAVVRRPGLSSDIDTPADLALLQAGAARDRGKVA